MTPPQGRRQANVLYPQFGMAFEKVRVIRAQRRQGLAARRQQQERRDIRRARRARRRRFDDHVGVGAADAEGTDARAPQRRIPRRRFRRQIEAGVAAQRVYRAFRADGGRNPPMLHRQRGLDQPASARRRVQMPDVRLQGAQRAACAGALAQSRAQRRQFDLIADRRARAVRLDIADRRSVHLAERQRLADHLLLSAPAGRGEAHLGRAVVVDRPAANHRHDGIAVGQRVLQAAQHHHAGAVAEDRAAAVCGERTASAVRGQNAALLVHISLPLRQSDAHPARHREIALEAQQPLHRLDHGDQRSRTRGLQRDGRAAEVEPVRNLSGQIVLVHAHPLLQIAVGRRAVQPVAHMVNEIIHAGRAGPDTDARAARRAVPCAFQRLMHAFKEDALLRIHGRRLGRRNAEIGGVELVDAVQRTAGADEAGLPQHRLRHAFAARRVRAEALDRHLAVGNHRPELFQGADAGQAATGADDRYGVHGC